MFLSIKVYWSLAGVRSVSVYLDPPPSRGPVHMKHNMGLQGIKGPAHGLCAALCVMRCIRSNMAPSHIRLARFLDGDSKPQMIGRPVRPGPYVVGGGLRYNDTTATGGGGVLVGAARVTGKARTQCASGVYVVELKGGRFYVGQSGNISHRMLQHLGKLPGGSAWCKANTFLGRVAPMTPPQADFESWERTETLARMHRHGIDAVRGWMYVSVELTQAQREHVFQQVCEKFNLCRACGGQGHFAAACRGNRRARWFTRFGGGSVPI